VAIGFGAAPGRTRHIRAAVACSIGYAILAVGLTYPLVRHLATRVPHDLGDPLLSTTILWWNAHQQPLSATWWNGPFFFPATGTLALSDHRLGESIVASPLQWAGLGPLAAYNVTLLVLFPLSALAAYWLAYTLTKRHDAALLAGIAYGFSPYRFAHIEHLELLAAFGMPAALAALHRYIVDRRTKWLVVFSAALLAQALSCSYYFLFFLVMLALWILWFVRWREVAILVGIGAASAVAAASMAPIGLRYAAIHEQYGLERGLNDIVELSADVTSLVTASPLNAVWGWTSTLNGPERQLFPGATVLVLVAIGMLASARSPRDGATRRSRAASALLVLAGVFAIIAATALWIGPWRLLFLSVGTPVKPFSLAVLALLAAMLCLPRVRDAHQRRSPFAFYVLGSAALFLISLGPKPAFLHHQILYQPPYAWLMSLSVFRGGVRVPARFGMLMILALSVAAALAYARFATGRRRVPVLALLVAGMLADSWIAGLPLLEPPAPWPARASALGAASFLDLPMGDVMVDSAAMYRAIPAGIPTVNGTSGYEPPHYPVLRRALESYDETALDAMAAYGPLVVAVERSRPQAAERVKWLQAYGPAKEVGADTESVWFLVERRPWVSVDCRGPSVPIVALRDRHGPLPLGPLQDGDENTLWTSGDAQRTGDMLLLDLGRAVRPCSVRLSLGSHGQAYPSALSIATSADGDSWQISRTQRVGGLAVRAVLDHPRNAVLELPVATEPARFIRLRIETDQPKAPWIVTELAVTAR
jgi:F5/8 type C domain